MNALILTLIEEPANSKQVMDCLKESGHEVRVVDCFVKAKTHLLSQRFDLIVSDVHLENGGNVFDFLSYVKSNELTSEIPFALFSLRPTPKAKYLADGVRMAAHALGADEYIEMEDFDRARFQDRVNSLLVRKLNLHWS